MFITNPIKVKETHNNLFFKKQNITLALKILQNNQYDRSLLILPQNYCGMDG